MPEHNTQIYLDDIIDYRSIFNGNSFWGTSVVLLAMDRCRDNRGCGQHSTWKWRSKWKCTTSPRARSDIKLRLGWTALSQQISLLWLLLLFGAGKPSLFPPNHHVSASTSQSGFQERWRQRSMNGPGWPVRRSHSTRSLCGTTASGTCHMSLAATGSLASAPWDSSYFGLDSPMINICLCLFLFKIQIVLVVGQFFQNRLDSLFCILSFSLGWTAPDSRLVEAQVGNATTFPMWPRGAPWEMWVAKAAWVSGLEILVMIYFVLF